MGFHAPGNESDDQAPAGPACRECGKPLVVKSTGRRPEYCGGSCSSKAARRRRQERQHVAVANALTASGIDLPDSQEAIPDLRAVWRIDVSSQDGLLAAARGVERLAHRFLHRLEEARVAGEDGDDPRANEALATLQSGLDATVHEVLRRAHVLRYQMVSRRREGAPGDSVRQETRGDAATVEALPDTPALLVPWRQETTTGIAAGAEGSPGIPTPLVSGRRETEGVADAGRGTLATLVPQRQETVPGRQETRPEASTPTVGAAPAGTGPRPPLTATAPARAETPTSTRDETPPLRLDLVAPAERGLGPALQRTPLPEFGPDWELSGWPGVTTLYIVVHQGLAVGWVEQGVNGSQEWIAVYGSHYLVDEDSGQPLWHAGALGAAGTVRLAYRQDTTR